MKLEIKEVEPGKHEGGDFILEGNVAFFILTRWFTKFTKSYKGG